MDLLCDTMGADLIGVWQKERKFLTTDAANEVLRPVHTGGQGTRQATQYFVTDRMAVAVVCNA